MQARAAHDSPPLHARARCSRGGQLNRQSSLVSEAGSEDAATRLDSSRQLSLASFYDAAGDGDGTAGGARDGPADGEQGAEASPTDKGTPTAEASDAFNEAVSSSDERPGARGAGAAQQ